MRSVILSQWRDLTTVRAEFWICWRLDNWDSRVVKKVYSR